MKKKMSSICFTAWALAQFHELYDLYDYRFVKSRIDRAVREFAIADECPSESIPQSYVIKGYMLVNNPRTREISLIRFKDNKRVTAKCKGTDEFSAPIGIGICWARMKKEEIPAVYEFKKLSEMKYKERFYLNSYRNKIFTFICAMPDNLGFCVRDENNIIQIFTSDSLTYEMI